jgi:predicted acylesterase/phospholipase RssA
LAVSSGGPELRLALTLPGGISLGTFEAGAVCALIGAIQHINARDGDRIRIDVIAGASAGALTSVLAARALLAGEDPVPSFRRAWVSEPSLRALLGHGPRAPLTLARARAVAQDVLARSAPRDGEPRQRSPVMLDMALVSLRGFSLEVPRPDAPSLPAASYLDRGRHTLEPIAAGSAPGPEQAREWVRAVEDSIASASHPVAFAAKLLDREDLRATYDRNGITDLPQATEPGERLRLWYTDGGLLDNQPLGRCLHCVAELDGEEATSRLVVLIRSDADRPRDAADPAGTDRVQPRWTETLGRSLDVLASHSASMDLRHVEKTNNRIRWISQVAETIAGLLTGDEDAARRELEDALDRVREQKAGLTTAAAQDDEARPAAGRPLKELVETALRTAAGLERMRVVDVAVVGRQTPHPLAAHGLAQVSGLLDPRRRRRDFAAGYQSMVAWMRADGGLRAAGVQPRLIDDACDAAQRRWREVGGARSVADGWRVPLLATRARLARLLVRALRVGLLDVAAMRRRVRRAGAPRRHA